MSNPYGWQHQKERAKHKPEVDAGQGWCQEIICLRQSRWINPAEPWDLAHNRQTGGYLGPSHQSCNRAEGGRYRHQAKAQRRWQL